MPKLKTSKTAIKRFKITGTGKLLKRVAGQDHFNSRESGKITKNKRRDIKAHKTNVKNLRKLFSI